MLPLHDPELLLYRLDLIGRRVLWVRLSAPQRREAAFLDERALTPAHQGAWMPLEMLLEAVSLPDPPLHLIFHIGHCGSTLLSRLLEHWPGLQVLREPLALRALAEAERERGSPLARLAPEQCLRLQRSCLALLARPLGPATRTIIKATSNCNDLIEPVLEMLPVTRALLLHIPLEAYLATVLKAPGSRLDAATFAPARLGYLHAACGDSDWPLHRLDEAQQVAMGWLAERVRFNRLLVGPLAPRLHELDFQDFLAEPELRLAALAEHFGLPAAGAAAAVTAPEMGRYAKLPEHRYDANDRAHDLAEAQRRHGDEIARARRWVEAFLARYPGLATGFVQRGLV